ncbi:hypothetical protein [Lysobacter gummosus]|uniref:Voltage gated chloride channel family protein n=1 Tax=Lysobacter gummosus TaxID=262324 RepID=A0ABY3XF58_9GAMM|nr:hypothetical protein [Lysobacter gummosus]ALN89641.1 hypothetical protein LG3211_0656 [Lysobacter gummosus]UNP30267.1 hypothetical protein MOV92_03015 [Lysobacter gummosus]
MGAATSVLVLSTLRMFYYLEIDRRPQMSPGMFVVFAPILVAPFVFGSVFMEYIARRFLPRLNGAWPWLIGASYTGVLFG